MEDNQAIRKHAGWALVGCGMLAGLALAHHPIGSGQGIMTPLVHGSLQAILLIELALFFLIARMLGGALTATIGAAFLGGGVLAGILAGTINGFVVPALGGYGENEIGGDVRALAWETNQALARLCVIATGVGYTLWSVLFWHKDAKPLAAFGVLTGLVPAALLVAGVIDMRFHGALFAYIGQSLWMVALGWHLSRPVPQD
ncbi:hypothetical protein LY632_09225 [Erythrobacter sp. SDW2]|uniref:hypothetical protein n=1 Tax=Erythrobacter sp. SDW2 TaxID=2907154 RepID=UPI001F42E74B|nr:hypothetical protein [Erythrobacter sp. SDW2]UIP05888.1 hypothetical protein LY632_09225 [Erythrobacter sp. SDW2]